MAGRFDGKVLLATGGGSGLAAATARRYTADGGRVAALDIDLDRARAVAAELDGAVGIECDVAAEDSVAAAVDRAVAELGRIDHVFNSAGIADFGPIGEWTQERFEQMLRIHVSGTFLVCRAVLPSIERGGGAIVNVASIAAIVAQPFNAPYGAAKAAISGYTRQLALEFAEHGIRVNAVAPGRIRTGMTEPLYTQRGGGSYEQGARMAAEHNPQGRVAEADEVAGPVCFLLSDDASFVSGQTLVIDGGETVV